MEWVRCDRRAGRADKPGVAVIQTFSPDNEIIRLAANQDYEGFYESQIPLRRNMLYPPFSELCQAVFVADGEEKESNGAGRADGCKCRCADVFPDDNGIGKIVRLLEEIADQHRDGKQDEQAGRIAGCHVKSFIVFHLSSKD